jgi:hypothetical protein
LKKSNLLKFVATVIEGKKVISEVTEKKRPPFWGQIGGPTGTRTQDQVIKSHLLYQLSYRSVGKYIMSRSAIDLQPVNPITKRMQTPCIGKLEG